MSGPAGVATARAPRGPEPPQPPDPTIRELLDAYEQHAERDLYSENPRAMSSLRTSLKAIRRILEQIAPQLRVSQARPEIYQHYRVARLAENPQISKATLKHEADELLVRVFTFHISSLGGFTLKQAAGKSRLGAETLLLLDAVGICRAGLKPPGRRLWRTWRWTEADITRLLEFRTRGRPSGDALVMEHAAWWLEDRNDFDGETLRRYRHALEAVCEIHGELRKGEVNSKTIADYGSKRQQRFAQQLKEAAKESKNIGAKTLEMEKWVHTEILLEGFSAADVARLTGMDQNSVSQRKNKGHFVPELPFGRYSDRQLDTLQNYTQLYNGGMPPHWFREAVDFLEQGRQPRFDRNLRKLVEDSRSGYQVLYPPEAKQVSGRDLPVDRDTWTATELWQEYRESTAFKGKPTANRRSTFAATMKNHWLPEIGKASVREIRDDVTQVVGGALERIAAKETVNSTRTLVTLLNNLQEVLATAGISLAEVLVPEAASKQQPLSESDRRERLRQIHAVYQKLEELENKDKAERKKAGLHALPGPWKDLVLLLFAPALRPNETTPMTWDDLVQGSGGTEIKISRKQSLDDPEPEPVSSDARRRLPVGRVGLLQWRRRARHVLGRDPIFANPRISPAKPYRRNSVWRHVLKDVGKNLGAGWVSLEAIRNEGIYWLRKLLQAKFADTWEAMLAQVLGEKRRGPEVAIPELVPIIDELQSYVVEGKEPAVGTILASPSAPFMVSTHSLSFADKLLVAMHEAEQEPGEAADELGVAESMVYRYIAGPTKPRDHTKKKAVRKYFRNHLPREIERTKLLAILRKHSTDRAAAAAQKYS